MAEREDLDLHVMVFTEGAPRGYEWQVIKSEERLADERFEGELKVESDKRQRTIWRPALGPAQGELFG